jgi:hypothetical protein
MVGFRPFRRGEVISQELVATVLRPIIYRPSAQMAYPPASEKIS